MYKIKMFSIVCTIILVVAIAVILIIDRNEKKEMIQYENKLEEKLTPLYVKIRDLKNKSKSLDISYSRLINGSGTLGLLYIGADEAIYDDIYPKTKQYDYNGVIAVSIDSFAGEENCMSIEHFKEMLNNGWKWCIIFPFDTDSPTDEVDLLLARASNAGIEKPQIIYFPDKSYSSEYDTWLSDNNIDIIIHQLNGSDNVIENEYKEGAWHCYAAYWRSTLHKEYLAEAIKESKDLIFEINLKNDYNFETNIIYHDSMLKILNDSTYELKIMTPDMAKQYRLKLEADRDKILSKWQSEKDAIETQIKELNTEIDNIRQSFKK